MEIKYNFESEIEAKKKTEKERIIREINDRIAMMQNGSSPLLNNLNLDAKSSLPIF